VPHKETQFQDHKKKFILVQTSSSPYYGLLAPGEPEQDIATSPGAADPFTAGGAHGIEGPGMADGRFPVRAASIWYKAGSDAAGPHDINLTKKPDIGHVDNFRVGMNCIWLNGDFGVPRPRRLIFNGAHAQLNFMNPNAPIKQPSITPDNVYQEPEQYGYGLCLLGTNVSYGGFMAIELPTRASLNEIFSDSDAAGYIAGRRDKRHPLSTPAKIAISGTPDSLSITGSHKTKQDISIAPAPGFAPTSIIINPVNEVVPPSWWSDPSAWAAYVRDNIEGTFEDFAFNMWWPFPFDKVEQSYAGAGSIRDIFVDIKPSYNFHIPTYENVIPDVPGSLLPNIYVFESESDESFKDEMNSRFKQHIDLAGKIKGTFVDVIKDNKKIETDKGQHFQKWAYAAGRFGPSLSPILVDLSERYKNLVFPMENLNLLRNVSGKERMFPMNIKIDFSTDINTKFADALQDSKLFSVLISEMINSSAYWISDLRASSTWKFEWWEAPYDPSIPQDPAQWDLGAWIDDVVINGKLGNMMKKLLGSSPNPFVYGPCAGLKGVFLGPYKEEVLSATRPEFEPFARLMMESFKDKLSKIVEKEFRTFKDLMQGKFAYSETLLYKVTRLRKVAVGTGYERWMPEQDIWFPNSREIDVLSYIDTQVKYNVPYRYVVVAYQMVIGNKYEYKVNELNVNIPVMPLSAKLCLFNEPSIKLIELPYYDSEIDNPNGIRIMDKPPVPPDVNIIPYKGVGNKILMWLNGNVGDYWSPDIRIFPDELSERDQMKRNKRGEINFKSDDGASSFEIIRMNKKPKRYSDFAIMGEPFFVSSHGASSAAFVDKGIRSNQKYYYIFRAIDSHGHTSNPSAVYEVELVKDEENVYPLINTIDMGLPPERQVTKEGRRFIEIKPSLIQSILDETELNKIAAEEIPDMTPEQLEQLMLWKATGILGAGTQSVWGSGLDEQKKFKIRLNSKLSGKKLDINLKFKINANFDPTRFNASGMPKNPAVQTPLPTPKAVPVGSTTIIAPTTTGMGKPGTGGGGMGGIGGGLY